MPEQSADIRNKNFSEVALGYTAEMAIEEADRCLGCKNKPCVDGCPVNVDIPAFITAIKNGKFEEGYKIIKKTNALPAVCGRVCPQENQCEGKCVRAKKGESVAIGRLERFCADYHLANNNDRADKSHSNGKKVAIVGSGPAGLSCAGDLNKMGYDVTIYEALHRSGGVLVYGIPEFRLPKDIVKKEIDTLEEQGVRIEQNMVIGKVLSIDELFEDGYEAIFIGSGAGLPSFMGVPGENLSGVFAANEYLTRINLMKAYREDYDTPIMKSRNVAVIGGGNVAMDAARCAKRLGAEQVSIVYRRGLSEMPARAEEIHHCQEEGVEFKLLTAPVEILGDERGKVNAMKCVKMELSEPDASGRRRPTEIPNSQFAMVVDTVILAIGGSPNPLLRSTTPGLEANRHGCLVTTGEAAVKTTREGVFAGGDIVTGAATVILAMGAGKKAAAEIDEYITDKHK